MSKLVFFYGTLKRKHYNYTRFFNDESSFVKEDTVLNFSLVQHDYLPYPHAVINAGGHINGEVHRIDDDRVYQSIRGMELGAGYKEVEVVTESGEVCLMYYSDSKREAELPNKFSTFER